MEIYCEEVQPGTTAILTPGAKQKVVHLIRHGQGSHNVFAALRHKEGNPCPCVTGQPSCPYTNAEHIDARLTQRGRLQAASAGARLLATGPKPEIVFVSPLWRTLETCSIALSKIPSFKVPVVAEEYIRERMGKHVCDRRSPVEEVIPRFSGVDFSKIKPGADSLFEQTDETPDDVAERGFTFFKSLADLPQTSIALFTHSSFLFNTISRKLQFDDDKVARRFETGEGRVLILTYKE